MSTTLTALLGSYSFVQVIFLALIIFLLYIIYIKVTDDSYYNKLFNIAPKYKARIREYIIGQLRIVEAESLNNVEKLLEITSEEDVEDENLRQFAVFSLMNEKAIAHYGLEEIETAIEKNGFHSMSEAELGSYIEERGLSIWSCVQSKIHSQMHHYKSLRGTDAERYSSLEFISRYGKIVRKSIKLGKDEEQERVDLKKAYSIKSKLNIVEKFLKKKKAK